MQFQAVFMDRDGVLNRYVRADYIRTPDELHLLPGAADAVRALNDRGLSVIVISNQQGVAKRIMTEDALDQVDGELRDQLKASAGAVLTHTYYCTHLASDNCSCRKPKPGLLKQASDEYGIDLAQSVMIGDSFTDIACGNNAGVGFTILLMTGAIEIVSLASLDEVTRPNMIARDIGAAVAYVIGA
jgi:histidinol-phosphate phosphatase family protein